MFVVDRTGAIAWKYISESVPERPPTADVLAVLEKLANKG